MKRILFSMLLLQLTVQLYGQQTGPDDDKIKVLNYATFHLSNSNDANTSPVNIQNPKVQEDVDRIVQKLVAFEPTIICVEVPVQSSAGTNEIYQEYKTDQSRRTNWAEEINSIAFEVGRLAGVENIYGIDSKLGFDYPKLMKLAEDSELETNAEFLKANKESLEEFNDLDLLGKFRLMNTDEWKSETLNFYNFLATMHTPGNYEGADIIADFYKRNLMIYTNFKDVPKDQEDRILIITGGTHTAYLDIFLQNNPGIELVDPAGYIVQ